MKRAVRLPGAMRLFGVLALTVGGCDDPPRKAELTWNEPVTLSNGGSVTVSRHMTIRQEFAFGGGFASALDIQVSTIELSSGTAQPVQWSAPLMPIVLDRDPANGDWILVATHEDCVVWLRNGMPEPNYWAFRLRNGEWFRDDLPQSFYGRRANLFIPYSTKYASQNLTESVVGLKRSQQAAGALANYYQTIDIARDFHKYCGNNIQQTTDRKPEIDLAHFRRIQ